MLTALEISASGLAAQRQRLTVTAANLANAFTTRDAAGRPIPYRRRVALLEAAPVEGSPGAVGVRVAGIAADPSPGRAVYDPSHPDADADGIVHYPNVDILTETVDAMAAVRAYEANVTAIEATKSMVASALRIIA